MAVAKSRNEAELLSESAKMMDFFRQEVNRRRLQAELPEAYEMLMMQIVEMWGAFMGNECEAQGLKNLWLDAGLEGASTYKDILLGLWSSTSDNVTLRLGCEVTGVTTSETCAVNVRAADGFQGFFDEVVITAPLGWLKRNENVFSPPLAPDISTAIHSLGYGNLDRVFIKFPGAFWNDHDPKSNDCHGCTLGKIGSPTFPIESLFLCPKYAADTNSAKWRQEIVSFSGLPEPFSQPVIMFFTYGQWGRHITGLVRGMAQNSQEYYRILDDNFRPYYSKLPNYDAAYPNCRPLKFMSTDWQGDKFAGFGSFTNLPTGSGDCLKHFEVLREGMGKDRGIWFAGEHTSPPGGLGTVTGAYWSGEEVSKRVANRRNITIENGVDVNQLTYPAPLPEDPELSYRELTPSDIAHYTVPNRSQMFMDALAETGRDVDLEDKEEIFWDRHDAPPTRPGQTREQKLIAQSTAPRISMMIGGHVYTGHRTTGSSKVKQLLLLRAVDAEHLDAVALEQNPTLLTTNPFERR
ncbi:MAG: hypothetical protein Q9223_001382 [Gallowayella weberi]